MPNIDRSRILLPSKAFESNLRRHSLGGWGSTLTFWTKKESAADKGGTRINGSKGFKRDNGIQTRIYAGTLIVHISYCPAGLLNLAVTAVRLFALWQLGLDSHLNGPSRHQLLTNEHTNYDSSRHQLLARSKKREWSLTS